MKVFTLPLLVLFLVGFGPTNANKEIDSLGSGVHESFLDLVTSLTEIIGSFEQSTLRFIGNVSETTADLADNLVSTGSVIPNNIVEALSSLLSIVGGNFVSDAIGKIEKCANVSDDNPVVRQAVNAIFGCIKSKIAEEPLDGVEDMLTAIQNHSMGLSGRIRDLRNTTSNMLDIIPNYTIFLQEEIEALLPAVKFGLKWLSSLAAIMPSLDFCLGKDVALELGNTLAVNSSDFMKCMM